MALDNANFIAELSITDPPGTDPLSQGDDQIRTIKRATQQSFPFIDKEVSLTADQMNLAAIKNEANVFTVTDNEFTERLILNAPGATAFRDVAFQVDSLNKWALITDSGNANRFSLGRFDNITGLFVDNTFTVSISTNVLNFLEMPTIQGAPIWIAGEIRQFVATASPGTNWFKADGLNGTVNLQGRHLMTESAFDTVGTSHDATLGVSQADSGDTTLTVAQMPAHDHRILGNDGPLGVLANLLAANARTFAGFGSVTPQFISTSGFGDNLMENTGSSGSHKHTVPVITIDDPGFTDAVRPVGFVVTSFQFVP